MGGNNEGKAPQAPKGHVEPTVPGLEVNDVGLKCFYVVENLPYLRNLAKWLAQTRLVERAEVHLRFEQTEVGIRQAAWKYQHDLAKFEQRAGMAYAVFAEVVGHKRDSH
jgi:hypothetical protein